MIAAAFSLALQQPGLRAGIAVAVAAALGGMTGAVLFGMPTAIAVTVCASWLLADVNLSAAPRRFDATMPGVSLPGPFNAHLIRAVGLFHAVGGLVGLHGALTASASPRVAAASRPCLHAVFRLQGWFSRCLPFEGVFLVDRAFVISPPLVVLAAVGPGGPRTGDAP